MFTRNLKVGKVFSEFIIVVMIDQPILSYFVFGDVKVIVQVRPNTDPVVWVRPDANYILQETHIMQWSRDCKHVRQVKSCLLLLFFFALLSNINMFQR